MSRLRFWRLRVQGARIPNALLWVALGIPIALCSPGRALAHAYLERSSPAGNTVVETAPQRIQLWFTERPELRFSDVTVYTAEGEKLSRGPLAIPPDNPRSLVFELGPMPVSPEPGTMPSGTYTVAWKTLSADDGHTSAGAFAYAVGLDQPAPTATSIFVPAGQSVETGRPHLLEVLGRWLGYGGAALVGGGPFFVAFVLWPAFRAAGSGARRAKRLERVGPGTQQRLHYLHALGLVLALVGALVSLMAQALAISGDNSAALRATLFDLLGTRAGLLFWARLLALGLVAVAVRQLGRAAWADQSRSWPMWFTLAATGGLLLAQSLGAHAAATTIWTSFTIAADWVHLAAMSVWLGGLALLLVVTPELLADQPEHERPALLARLVGRFSAIAVWCVALLILTGLYQSWVHVGQVDGLTRTDYGIALLVKLALVLPLLLLGALNLFVHRPGLAQAAGTHARQATKRAGSLTRRLGLALRGEVALGAAVLLATGVLANLPPAREALFQRGRAETRSSQVGELKLTVTVDPAVAGLNTYDVAISDASGKPVDNAQAVALRFRHSLHDMGEIEAVLQPRGDGHYTAQGSFLSMAGLWEVDVRVRLPGREDAVLPVEIQAADPSAADLARAASVPSLGTTFLLGLELLTAALVVTLAARGGLGGRLPLPPPLRKLVPRLAAAVLGAVGLYFLSIGIMNDLTPTAALANPIPPTRASLARGKEIYEQNCLACHGESGRGDGPTGRVLRPRPADLQQHTTSHTEGQLYWWITKGFPGSPMPAFEDRLSEEDRWHVLNYIVQTFKP